MQIEKETDSKNDQHSHFRFSFGTVSCTVEEREYLIFSEGLLGKYS